jgi:hypothetical protein
MTDLGTDSNMYINQVPVSAYDPQLAYYYAVFAAHPRPEYKKHTKRPGITPSDAVITSRDSRYDAPRIHFHDGLCLFLVSTERSLSLRL